MHISISGTHGTGKTLLSKLLFERLNQEYPNQVTLIDEIERRLHITKGLPLNQLANLETYINIIYERLKSERLAKTIFVISDRSLLDNYAYSLLAPNCLVPNNFKNMFKEIFLQETKYFDLYIYLPIQFSIIPNNIRSTDIEYQKLIDKKIKHFLYALNLPTIKVSGSIEERANIIIKEIHKRHFNH